MRITPLILHAQRRLPALTDLFSDALSVTQIACVSGGTTTVTCAAAHGVTIASDTYIIITDSEIPNPVTAAEVLADGNIKLTTQYPHDLTTRPPNANGRVQAWHSEVKLSGFGDGFVDGTKALVDVPDRNTFTIKPTGEVLSVTIDGGETLHETLNRGLIGYHKVTAATGTTFAFNTPATITRDITVTSQVVVRNVRIYGACTFEAALDHFVRPDNTTTPVDKLVMFVVPVQVKASQSRNARLDGVGEIRSDTDYRQPILDGFDVYVIQPTEADPGGVVASDRAHGTIFSAVMGTFFGLNLPKPEYCDADQYVATLESHGVARYDGANHVHRYRFQQTLYLRNADAIKPYDWPDIDPENLSDSLYPISTDALHDIHIPDKDEPLADGSFGIKRKGEPGSLDGNVKLDETVS